MKAERVDRLFSRLGICSRSEMKSLLRTGLVTENGKPVKTYKTKVDPELVRYDGKPLEHPGGVRIIFHKPVDVVCSREGDGTFFDFLPDRWRLRKPLVNSIGRLDKNTSGLLLITDDGKFNHRIISPKNHINRTYFIEVDKPFNGLEPYLFSEGNIILQGEDKPCKPAELKILTDTTAELTMREGKYHQVRRMFSAIHHHVIRLHRIKIGSLTLDGLEPGEWRDLTEEDMEKIGV